MNPRVPEHRQASHVAWWASLVHMP